MTGVYFVHQIKHTRAANGNNGTWTKGIVVKDSVERDNCADAKQAFHAYLGAYGYGNDPTCDYAYCAVTDLYGSVVSGCEDAWFERTE